MKRDYKKIDGTAIQILVSLICIISGAILKFVPQVRMDILCYIFCVVLILAGAFAILRFFMAEGYKELQNYNFSIGLFFILLGCIGLIRTENIIQGITGYMGMISMVLGIVILQGMVQLRVLRNPLWIAELILAVVSLTGSLFVLLDVTVVSNVIDGFSFWVFMIVGGLSLISLLLVWIGIKGDKKQNGFQQ